MHTRLCKTQLLNITAVNTESHKIKSHVETTRSSETEKKYVKDKWEMSKNSEGKFKFSIQI